MKSKATPIPFFLLFIISLSLLVSTQPSLTCARPDSSSTGSSKTDKKHGKGGGTGGVGPGNDVGGFFGPGGGGFAGIPGFGSGWSGGYGGGYGGPSGGYSKGGIIRPTVECKERGPCYKKKLTCPAKCFTSYSRSGKGYGGGGGGGGCTMDCKKCVAYC